MDWNGFSNFRTVWSVSCLSGSSINTRIPIVKAEFPSNSEFIMRCIRPNRETVSQTRLTHFPILLGRDEHLSYSFSGILHSRSPRPPPPAPAAAAKPATNANWFTKAQNLNRWFPRIIRYWRKLVFQFEHHRIFLLSIFTLRESNPSFSFSHFFALSSGREFFPCLSCLELLNSIEREKDKRRWTRTRRKKQKKRNQDEDVLPN